MVSSASLRSRSLRSAFVADCDATPPPPNLEPARFYGLSVAGWTYCATVTYLVIHLYRLSSVALSAQFGCKRLVDCVNRWPQRGVVVVAGLEMSRLRLRFAIEILAIRYERR
jgi:hypothetical protein